MKIVLIVDDELKYTTRFESFLADEPIQTLVAHNLEDAIELATLHEIDAATIDFAIAGQTGNQVATALDELYQGLPMAGLTGGDPNNFDEDLYLIRTSKTDDKQTYLEIVHALLSGVVPDRYVQKHGQVRNELTALSILTQGYTAALMLLRGEQPFEGVVMPMPDIEKVNNIFDLEVVGINGVNLASYLRRQPGWDDPLLVDYCTLLADGFSTNPDEQTANLAQTRLAELLN